MTEHDPTDQISWTLFLLSEEQLNEHQFEKIRQRWWVNPTNRKSLRLSKEGYRRISQLKEITGYTHRLSKKVLPKTFLQLERSFDYPYFIQNLSTLILFDQKNSIMLTLYDNDLQSYLDNVEKYSTDDK